jgi:hypothetical protein
MIRSAANMGPLDPVVPSPQGDRTLVLEYHGEVRFGPPYYLLWNQQDASYVGPGQSEIYGDKAYWSTNGRYLALERWLSLTMPDNVLEVLDLKSGRKCIVAQLGANFVQSVFWWQREDGEQSSLTYLLTQYRQDEDRGRNGATVAIDAALEWVPADWWNAGRGL